MNYFISENVFTFNSGTEHSQMKRVKLFNAQGQPALYVTRNYNRAWHVMQHRQTKTKCWDA